MLVNSLNSLKTIRHIYIKKKMKHFSNSLKTIGIFIKSETF